MRNQKTAILLFSLNPSQEAVVKNYHPSIGFKKNQKLASHLIEHSLKEAQSTGLPILNVHGNQQKGNHFGEKLANAIESGFQQGFEKLIIIGNDCPDISSQLLLKAKEDLLNNDVVLGPAKDGGVYLIGLQRKFFHKEKFTQLPWQNKTLSTYWKQELAEEGRSISWLEEFQDIDNLEDLRNYRLNYRYRLFTYIISIIVYGVEYPLRSNSTSLFSKLSGKGKMPLRAPPSPLSLA